MVELLPHIYLHWEPEWIILRVETLELMDYVEDYLTEDCDIEYDYFVDLGPLPDHPKEKSYDLYFPKSYPVESITNAISKLDTQEVIRIFKLNI